MRLTLAGKTALVTGSTSGIGAATAEALAAHGAQVAVNGRDEARGAGLVAKIRAAGGEAVFIKADLSGEHAAARLVEQAAEHWGKLDILVNNAAFICNKPLERIVSADWDRLFALNVKAAFLAVQAAVPWLEQAAGCVVNVGSINGIRNSPGDLVYDVTKAALNHLTTGLALELRSRGVRVNALLPGGVDTPLIDQWWAQAAAAAIAAEPGTSTGAGAGTGTGEGTAGTGAGTGTGEGTAGTGAGTGTGEGTAGTGAGTGMAPVRPPRQLEQILREARQDPALGRPEAIADAVVFLAGPHARWISGAIVPIDGGYYLGSDGGV